MGRPESAICQLSPGGEARCWDSGRPRGGDCDPSCPQESLLSCVRHSHTRQRHGSWRPGFLVSWFPDIRCHLIQERTVWLPDRSLMGKQYVA